MENNFWKLKAPMIIAFISALISSYFGYKNYRLDKEIESYKIEMEREQNRIMNELKEYELINSISLRVYQEVVKAISEENRNDSLMQEAAIVMVQTVVKDFDFSTKLLDLIRTKTNNKSVIVDVANMKEEIAKHDLEQNEIRQKGVKLQPSKNKKFNGFLLDIFFCEETAPDSKTKATALLEKLKPHCDSVRLRKLPLLTNKKIGYRIKYNQIRYNTGEVEMAQAIAEFVNSETEDVNVELRRSYTKTNSYLSLFVYN